MLEDRDYEVAKDEHNRRLFSKKDVKVLQEMIKIAECQGKKVESVADEIIKDKECYVDNINNEADHVKKVSDYEISILVALEHEKLDKIQKDNKEHKTNKNSLVHRLE